MIKTFALVLCSLCITPVLAQQEVMYHVTIRSFFDSDGDGNGDLKGIQQKLDYLQQFGINTISLSPIYQSDFYNNLYAGDLEKIDAEYGAFKEYRDLIQNIHLRKMKLYQEIDLQYISTNHLWFKDSFKNTKSAYNGYVYYTDAKNEKPYYLPDVTTYTNTKEQAVAVNLKNTKVQEYYTKVLKYWADPNGDGNFNEGVDGFRIVDMQDKIDNSGKTSNQLKSFYAPLFDAVKKVNPKLLIMAENYDTKTFGNDFYTKANVDRVLTAKLREAILSFDKNKINTAADSIFVQLPAGKYPVNFIEDENTVRTASLPGMNIGKIRVAGALSFLMGGVPCIYNGQELGMKGDELKTGTNGDKIPLQEAFEWSADESGEGMAFWYKDSGAYWDKRFAKPNDGISLEEQQKDDNSLWNFYKKLIRLKKMQPALALGNYREIRNTNDNVISFLRTYSNRETEMFERAVVVINLSGENQLVSLEDNEIRPGSFQLVFGTPNVKFTNQSRSITLTPYTVQVWRF